MDKVTPRTLAGFMELLPAEQIEFERMLTTIRSTFELFGFAPLETPALELSEVLLAKAGGDTEKQIYRFTRGDTDVSMRFDLTVPLARYVAQRAGQLTFPFRRYQTQKVWRAERPQRGRFREFMQCDIDVIGSESTLVDAEIPSVIYAVFTRLRLGEFTIRINNRKVLNGFLASIGAAGTAQAILRIIDKLEKQDRESLTQELRQLGLTDTAIQKLFDFVTLTGTAAEVLAALGASGITNDLFVQGVQELTEVVEGLDKFGVPAKNFTIDLSIARGLDYYTGTIYETILNDLPGIGSVCSGGRYDDLASFYTDQRLPGVGISIGLTRLFDQLRANGRQTIGRPTPAQVLVACASPQALSQAQEVATLLRQATIATELYTEEGSLGKQLKYANKLGLPWVVIAGMREAGEGQVMVKNMATGTQTAVLLADVPAQLKAV